MLVSAVSVDFNWIFKLILVMELVVCYTANRIKITVKMVAYGVIGCVRLFWESLVALGQLGWLLLLVM